MTEQRGIMELERLLKQELIPEIRQEIQAALESGAAAPPRWIKGVAAASKIAAIHKDTLRELLREGEIRGYQRDGGTWIIDRKSLDEYHEAKIQESISRKDMIRQKIVANYKKNY